MSGGRRRKLIKLFQSIHGRQPKGVQITGGDEHGMYYQPSEWRRVKKAYKKHKRQPNV